MSGITDTINNAKNSVIGFSDDLSSALDFGGTSSSTTASRKNPEKDLTEVERANPTNVHFPGIGGLSPAVLIIGGVAIIGVVFLVLRK